MHVCTYASYALTAIQFPFSVLQESEPLVVHLNVQ